MPTHDNMVTKTNFIDDFPAHWKATLLGDEFWKDAEDWNRDTNNQIETGEYPVPSHSDNTTLNYCIKHRILLNEDTNRFPFNIGPEQTPAPRAPSIITTAADSDNEVEVVVPEKRNRRFSMSDAFTVSALTGRSGSSLFPPNRLLDLSRQSRSRSRFNNLGRSSSVTADVRRSNSVIRSTFNKIGRRKKMRDEDGEEEGELEFHTQERAIVTPTFPPDQATPANPLMEFRGGSLWAALPRDRRALGLDVFWPVLTNKLMHKTEKSIKHNQNKKDVSEEEEEDGEHTVFPIHEMAPLCMFRNLRVLKITGMMQSYQMYIFQAAWLNTNLEELEIEMALTPRLRRGYKWPYMMGEWCLDRATYGEPVYYGNGEGSLVRAVGVGEYLDKICLEKAKIRAMAMGNTRNRLSIRTLVLSGVVVDADPFLHWFDPKRLRCINFKENCVDAGFWLSHCMQKVSVLFPRQIEEHSFTGCRVNPLAELKVVELKGGKKIGEIPYRGPKSLEEDIPKNVGIEANSIKRREHAKEGVVDKD